MTLVTVRPGVAFQAPAAESFMRYEAIIGREADVNRTTESAVQQQKAYDAYRAYQNGGAWAPLALDPSKSKHVYREGDPSSATAWDTDERDAFLDACGWIADVEGEPWHREYREWLDTMKGFTVDIIEQLTKHRVFPGQRNIFDQLIFIANMTAIAANKDLTISGSDATAEAIADELAKRLAD